MGQDPRVNHVSQSISPPQELGLAVSLPIRGADTGMKNVVFHALPINHDLEEVRSSS